MTRVILALGLAFLTFQQGASAKRTPPKKVAPLVHAGVEYRAPHRRMGYVEAWDVDTGKKLWEKKIYRIWIAPWLEEDVQWVFIAELKIENGRLVVTDERGRRYAVDPRTGEVEGARIGLLVWAIASAAAVALAAAGWWITKRGRRRRGAAHPGSVGSEAGQPGHGLRSALIIEASTLVVSALAYAFWYPAGAFFLFIVLNLPCSLLIWPFSMVACMVEVFTTARGFWISHMIMAFATVAVMVAQLFFWRWLMVKRSKAMRAQEPG
ncbi:MAG: hypothetical protein ACYSU0_13760 [Planctomycetota bacterium]